MSKYKESPDHPLKIMIDNTGSAVPVYIQIKRQVLDFVQANNYKAGDPMPDIATIAQLAGVSLRTANQAMDSLAAEGLCVRRPKHGTFYSDLKVERRKMCVILQSEMGLNGDDIEFELYRGVYNLMMEKQIDVSSLHSSPDSAFKFYSRLDMIDLLGMAVLDMNMFGRVVQLAKKHLDKTFVLLNCCRDDLELLPQNCYAIQNDDFNGSFQLVEHFALRNCKTMAILTNNLINPHDTTYKCRIDGYLAAAEKYGISVDAAKDIIALQQSGNSAVQLRQGSYLALRGYLASCQRIPDVILCTNDLLALGAKKCLRDLEADEKTKVAGYDGLYNYQVFADDVCTMKIDFGQMGKYAAKLLDGFKCENRIIKIAPTLIAH